MNIAHHGSNYIPAAIAVLRLELRLGQDAASVRANVVQALREAILSGALKPGDRLSDAKLCEDYGVSRTSIREALRYLESEKLITILRNRRACIARVTPQQATTIYELLAALLGDAAALLAGTATTRTMQQLRAVKFALGTACHGRDATETRRNLSQFHSLILDACGDTVLSEVGSNLLARIGYLRACALRSSSWHDGAVMNTLKMIRGADGAELRGGAPRCACLFPGRSRGSEECPC